MHSFSYNSHILYLLVNENGLKCLASGFFLTFVIIIVLDSSIFLKSPQSIALYLNFHLMPPNTLLFSTNALKILASIYRVPLPPSLPSLSSDYSVFLLLIFPQEPFLYNRFPPYRLCPCVLLISLAPVSSYWFITNSYFTLPSHFYSLFFSLRPIRFKLCCSPPK